MNLQWFVLCKWTTWFTKFMLFAKRWNKCAI